MPGGGVFEYLARMLNSGPKPPSPKENDLVTKETLVIDVDQVERASNESVPHSLHEDGCSSTDTQQYTPNSLDVYCSLLCGACAGIVAKSVIAPAERIKMSFQVCRDKFTLQAAARRGIEVFHKEGILSLWKGHSTTVLRVAPYSGFSYAIHDFAEQYFKRALQEERLPSFYKFVAGAIGGIGGTILTYPLDVLRVRLALGHNWNSAVRQGGMYQGMTPTLLGVIPYAGTAWCVKQTLLEYFPTVMKRKPVVLESILINAIAGMMGQFVSYPLDVVRRRMQVAKTIDGKGPPTLREVWIDLIATEGWRGAAKGFSLNIIKGPIALSVSLTTYDLLRNFFNQRLERR